jgi:hypothetical protein
MGEVKIRTAEKDASVFIDGGYAGVADKLRSIWLDPGAYNIELHAGQRSYSKRIYVLSGKRVTLEPEFQVRAEKEARP